MGTQTGLGGHPTGAGLGDSLIQGPLDGADEDGRWQDGPTDWCLESITVITVNG